jgi:glycosyltransferase involved in cell wall biosynthesis
MKFHVVSPRGHWNPGWMFSRGLGGSETHHAMTSMMLSFRGHEVHNYIDLCGEVPAGHGWYDLKERLPMPSAAGVWILHRCPEMLDDLKVVHPNQTVMLVCHDIDYFTETYPFISDGKPAPTDNVTSALTSERLAKVDFLVGMSPSHVSYLRVRYPTANVVFLPNGIYSEYMREVLVEDNESPDVPDRFRIAYTSNPDRGLIHLLRIFEAARHMEPRLSLHVYYGWSQTSSVQRTLISRNWSAGVYWHGRVPQQHLWSELSKTGLWVYPTSFVETGCISIMEAQACGCFCIVNPIWAVGDFIVDGASEVIEGDPSAYGVRKQYVNSILHHTANWRPGCPSQSTMDRFDWEVSVDMLLSVLGIFN